MHYNGQYRIPPNKSVPMDKITHTDTGTWWKLECFMIEADHLPDASAIRPVSHSTRVDHQVTGRLLEQEMVLQNRCRFVVGSITQNHIHKSSSSYLLHNNTVYRERATHSNELVLLLRSHGGQGVVLASQISLEAIQSFGDALLHLTTLGTGNSRG